MKRVMLIQPPSNIMSSRKEGKPALPPYGLVCLAGSLRQAGHEVQIYDMLTEGYEKEVLYPNGKFIRYGDNQDDLSRRIETFRPDVVGVSCMASLRHFEACDVVKWVKECDPAITTVMGGIHPSSLPELVLNDCGSALNHIIKGEGERAIVDIVNSRTEHNPVCNRIHSHPLTKQDAEPSPAHDLLPLDKYVEVWNKHEYYFFPLKGRTISSTTSRGCVNRCEHCPHDVIFGKGWRKRKISNILKEAEFAVSLGVTDIQYHEYNGLVEYRFVEGVAKALKPLNIRWGYPEGVWLQPLDKPLLETMYNAGMDYINLAIESPHADVLSTMPGKDVNISHAERVVKWCRDIGFYINAFFMIGFPDQTIADMNKTVDYAISLDIDTAVFFIAQPLPGSPSWHKVEFIDGFHPMMLRYGKCNIKSKNWTAQEVEAVRHEGRAKFLRSRAGKGRVRGGTCVVREAL